MEFISDPEKITTQWVNRVLEYAGIEAVADKITANSIGTGQVRGKCSFSLVCFGFSTRRSVLPIICHSRRRRGPRRGVAAAIWAASNKSGRVLANTGKMRFGFSLPPNPDFKKMRDQFAGDIGDYVKYGLLSTFAPTKLGVIWYKTDGNQQGNDGRHTDYLQSPQKYRDLDCDLFDKLRCMVYLDKERSIAQVEHRSILPLETIFFSKTVSRNRKEWFEDALQEIKSCEVIFVDPDNGLTENVIAKEKHISLKDVEELSKKASVLIYHHHQTRYKGGHEAEIKYWQQKLSMATRKRVSAIRSGAYSPRVFFLVTDCKQLEEKVYKFSNDWRAVLQKNKNIPHYYSSKKPTMKPHLKHLLAQAVDELCRQGVLEQGADALAEEKPIHIERTRNSGHGDFASNLAMVLAKQVGGNPRALAGKLVAALPASALLEKTEIAGAGFINFFLSAGACRAVINDIHQAGKQYGFGTIGAGRTVLVEFVSANPTGPLHVGHGRGAAYGDAVVRLLCAAGYEAHGEYYVNDAGRQMDILAVSVWLRYLELCGRANQVEFPANAYRGDYVGELATDLHRKHGDALVTDASFANLPEDPEARIDALIERCKSSLGKTAYHILFDHGCDTLVEQIRADLLQFGVRFDRWFSERSLLEGGDIKRAIATLEKNGHIYEKDRATWFRAQDFGDEKDRAVLRGDGSHTYFASDIAYHFNKAERGFDVLLNVFGADHHGYAGRVKASFEALGFARERLQVRLVQFAVLYRGGKKIPMSTRAGEFVTLRELREEVGVDAARFFYVSRKNDQHMDFDLDLAKAQSADNPVYYIQYAHARICSVFRQLPEKNIPSRREVAPDYELLVEPGEFELMKTLLRFPEVVEQAAVGYEPHLLAYYLRDLANDFHAYYNAHPFLSSEANLRLARLGLIDATRQVIANGLDLLGVGAPQKM